MDEELGKQFGVTVAEHWFENDMISVTNHKYKAILKLTTPDDLQQIMTKNMPYLQLRARQVLHGKFAFVPRGLSLTFSLFSEIAGRDEGTIHRAFSEIFYLIGTDKYYNDINGIRAPMKIDPLGNVETRKATARVAFPLLTYTRGSEEIRALMTLI